MQHLHIMQHGKHVYTWVCSLVSYMRGLIHFDLPVLCGLYIQFLCGLGLIDSELRCSSNKQYYVRPCLTMSEQFDLNKTIRTIKTFVVEISYYVHFIQCESSILFSLYVGTVYCSISLYHRLMWTFEHCLWSMR